MLPLLTSAFMGLAMSYNIPTKSDIQEKKQEEVDWWHKVGKMLPRKKKKIAKKNVLFKLAVLRNMEVVALDI